MIEKKNEEKNKIPITINEQLNNLKSSIFFPNQMRTKLEQMVAPA